MGRGGGTCSRCGRPLGSTDAHVVLNERYVCSDCAYLADHPDAEIAARRRPETVEQLAAFDPRDTSGGARRES